MRPFRRIIYFLRSRLRAIMEWASLLLIGAGLGWCVHPGFGMFASGAIILGLLVYGRLHQLGQVRKEAVDA